MKLYIDLRKNLNNILNTQNFFGLSKSAAENFGRRSCDPFTRVLSRRQEEVKGRGLKPLVTTVFNKAKLVMCFLCDYNYIDLRKYKKFSFWQLFCGFSRFFATFLTIATCRSSELFLNEPASSLFRRLLKTISSSFCPWPQTFLYWPWSQHIPLPWAKGTPCSYSA